MSETPKPFPSLKELDKTLDFLNGEGMNDLANIVTNEIEARKEVVAWLRGQFENAMKSRVEEKQEEYGDSWKTIDIHFLRRRVEQNFKEWRESYVWGYQVDEGRAVGHNKEVEKRKLVDLANLCRFLWERLNEKGGDR